MYTLGNLINIHFQILIIDKKRKDYLALVNVHLFQTNDNTYL